MRCSNPSCSRRQRTSPTRSPCTWRMPMSETRERKNLFPGYPKGWFVISFADELEKGGVLPVEYFGKQMVLFRGEDGVPRLLDRYCAHLGASLAHGSKVIGNTIECPFHAWRYDGSGQCV